MQRNRENPAKRTEEYHFRKAKQASKLVSCTPPHHTLTPIQTALLACTLFHLVQSDISAKAAYSPKARSLSPKGASICPSNTTRPSSVSAITPLPTPIHHTPPLAFHGHLMIEATSQLTRCEKKQAGTSYGKICYFNNKKYLLKHVEEAGFFSSGTRYFAANYHHHLLQHYINITVPNMMYLHEKSMTDTSKQIYLGTEFIEGFTKIGEIYQQVDYALFGTENWLSFYYHSITARPLVREKLSEAVRKQLNENEIAKLVAAGTFINDLVNNEGNWGIANNRLVIVDMDSHESIINDPIKAAQAIDNLPINLSLNTIVNVIDIYKKMLVKAAPSINKQIDLSQAEYESLIKTYMKGCRLAAKKIIEDSGIDVLKPSQTINHLLSESIRQVAKESRHWLNPF